MPGTHKNAHSTELQDGSALRPTVLSSNPALPGIQADRLSYTGKAQLWQEDSAFRHRCRVMQLTRGESGTAKCSTAEASCDQPASKVLCVSQDEVLDEEPEGNVPATKVLEQVLR